MEKLAFNNLGQWDLNKTDHRIPATQHHADWVWEAQGDAASKAKMNIPRMSGSHRRSALDILKTQTQSRIGKSGETEYLLHRGGQTGGVRDHAPDERTSWTPVLKYAHRQAYYEDKPGKVGSAWIPESQLHSGLAHHKYDNPQTQKTADAEQEWIVTHERPITPHKVVDSVNPRTVK